MGNHGILKDFAAMVSNIKLKCFKNIDTYVLDTLVWGEEHSVPWGLLLSLVDRSSGPHG